MYRDIFPGGADTASKINVIHRLDLVERVITLPGLRVLDCGCGAGGYFPEFIRRGADVHGIEYLPEKVEKYLATGGDPSRIQVGNIDDMPFPDEAFDLVFMNEVIDHVPDEKKALTEIRRVLKPGGLLVVFAPNRFYPFETHSCQLRAWRREVSHLTPFIPWIPLALANRFLRFYARNYWPWEVRSLLRSTGYEITYRAYAWQTFENKGGYAPTLLQRLSTPLRHLSLLLEKIPLLRCFGVSSMTIAKKH
ncbi:MAG: class I SAM-dependent methyltransferase [Azonexus sp.]|nr:class I SAM-dependent methyltransferase [Azonexus sp.]